LPEVTQQLEAEHEEAVQGMIQGPKSPRDTSKDGVLMVLSREQQLTWPWAGHSGHPAQGWGRSAHPHCSRSRKAPGPGRSGCGRPNRGGRIFAMGCPEPEHTSLCLCLLCSSQSPPCPSLPPLERGPELSSTWALVVLTPAGNTAPSGQQALTTLGG
jgi:hypothetical protein